MEYTVVPVETLYPGQTGYYVMQDGGYIICRCFMKSDADRICNLLNKENK